MYYYQKPPTPTPTQPKKNHIKSLRRNLLLLSQWKLSLEIKVSTPLHFQKTSQRIRNNVNGTEFNNGIEPYFAAFPGIPNEIEKNSPQRDTPPTQILKVHCKDAFKYPVSPLFSLQ